LRKEEAREATGERGLDPDRDIVFLRLPDRFVPSDVARFALPSEFSLRAQNDKAARTLSPAYFDAVYASNPDPWKFATSAYERHKYSVTLAALPRPRYPSALEVGCSIGVLTRDLALRCDDLMAIDAAEAPLMEARRRCADRPTVRFEQMFAPQQWPRGLFDLILLSEVVYYFAADDVARLASRVARSLAYEANVVLVHWTGETNYPLSGDDACDLFIARMEQTARLERRDRHQVFRLDVLVKR
jgi:SAM-dependent methyltransferase